MPSDPSRQLSQRERDERTRLILSVVLDCVEDRVLELGSTFTAHVGTAVVEVVVRSEDR